MRGDDESTHDEPQAAPQGRAWEQVLAHIERDLLDGTLKPGDRLPGERDLASSLGVGRSSVREAHRALEVLGLIRTATGSGPSAGAMIIATPRGGMTALLRLQLAAQGFPLHDIVRTRLLLETAVAGDLAAAVDPELDEARAAFEAMSDESLTPDEFLALDAQFHLSLAEASGNVVVAAMMAGLRDSIESYVRSGALGLADWTATVTRLRDEHADIMGAIERHDADAARTLIHDHISGYFAEIDPDLT